MKIGSRPGGMIASAWIIMNAMGQSGYMALADKTMKTTLKIVDAIEKNIPELTLVAPPNMTCIAIISKNSNINILAVADVMDSYGWKMERQQLPDSIHMSMMPHHEHVVDKLIIDLKKAVQTIKENPNLNNSGTTGMYGMVASIPDKSIVNSFVSKFFSSLYTTEPNSKSIIQQYEQLVKLNN